MKWGHHYSQRGTAVHIFAGTNSCCWGAAMVVSMQKSTALPRVVDLGGGAEKRITGMTVSW